MKHRHLTFGSLAALVALGLWFEGCAKKEPVVSPPPPPHPVSESAPPLPQISEPAPEFGAVTDIVFEIPKPKAETPVVATVPFGDLRVVNDEPFPDMYFKHYGVNPTIDTAEEPLSTFSVDVDRASYNVTRAYLDRSAMPPEEAIRVEEFINSFDYDYPPPRDAVFSLQAEAFPSPNRHGYHVLHLGLQGFEVDAEDRAPAHLVFVIDVSGSMEREDRLGLVKASLQLLVDQLDDRDTIGIVVYGDRGRVILEPTGLAERRRILAAIKGLRSTGSTNAQEGILLGYGMAARHLDNLDSVGATHRIVLCSDGVANNGISTSADGIFDTVRDEAKRGITISTVGFGMGNYNDTLMERLAQIGDGNYHYVDRLGAARKLFVGDLTQTLQVIAKDVKIQVAFDPAVVSRYRLLGYENRRLENQDFDDDRKDAGEIGAGHAVTALYEVKLASRAADLGTVKVRYKAPEGGASKLIEKVLPRVVVRGSLTEASTPAQLSLVVASFAEKLRGSYWVRNLSYGEILTLHDSLDPRLGQQAEVQELRSLIVQAEQLDKRGDKFASLGSAGDMEFDHVPILQ